MKLKEKTAIEIIFLIILSTITVSLWFFGFYDVSEEDVVCRAMGCFTSEASVTGYLFVGYLWVCVSLIVKIRNHIYDLSKAKKTDI
ncbi:MAG: hypothetical protein CMQ38_12800 [Gammaproteobacteria bacterium]|nr:hypothetical protein [Gammaproteobacteria bacterium]